MPSCDYEHPPDDSDVECLFGDVLVERCDPSSSTPDCRGGFGCYRTDFLLPTGVCVPFPVCSDNSDCKDPSRNRCATNVVMSFVGEDTPIFADHLMCLGVNCLKNDGRCPDASSDCLGKVYRLEYYALPDICVPKCSGTGACPPNFACANSNVAAGVDPICIPGFPGVRCERTQDCVFGACEPTGAGFSVCTIECVDDASCEVLNTPPTYFRCVSGPEGLRHCVTAAPFQGLFCDSDENCTPDAPFCTDYNLFEARLNKECRPRCAQGKCSERGGLAQVCLADGSCYPGVFGVPCTEDSECLTPYSCLDVELDGHELREFTKICTIECREDADCEQDPEHPKRLAHAELGYCDGAACRVRALDGEPCDRDAQCRSKNCGEDRLRSPGKLCLPSL
jgi:hypothetical protein